MSRLAIVIAAYNEASQLGSVLEKLPIELLGIEKIVTVVVDDGSKDTTAAIAADKGAIVLRHSINRGQGAALQTGLDYAQRNGFTYAVTFDADGQHDAGEIKDLLQPVLQNEVDIALGSRFLSKRAENISTTRTATLKAGVLFTRLISRIAVTDTHNGFRAFGPVALQKIQIKQDKMEHASEILEQIGFYGLRYKEVPVTIRYSEYSVTKGQKSSNAFRIAANMIAYKFMV